MDVNIFPEQDTRINCNLPDGTKISVDAMDLDHMVAEVYQASGKIALPVSEILEGVQARFKKKHGFDISKRSVDILLEAKDRLLSDVKKNSYHMLDQQGSTDSDPQPPESTATSDSANQQ